MMKVMQTRRLFILLLTAASIAHAGNAVGPPKGSVLAAGGGKLGPEVLNKFIDLAGGPDAPIVFIPTASPPGEPILEHRLSAIAKSLDVCQEQVRQDRS